MSNPIKIYADIVLRPREAAPQLETTAHIAKMLDGLGLSNAAQEEVWVIAIDGSRNVRHVIQVAKGGYHDCDVAIPAIFSAVLLAGTDRFAIAHNHPSGELNPTNQDFDLTWRVSDAADVLDMIFEDHLIMTPNGDWYSFRGHKQMRPSKRPKVSS
jgi:DNA repair protein RadC